jgi:hypothetical protein
MTWFWTLLMGLGMLGGGILTLVIAALGVVLPYDEIFSGMSRDQLAAVNPRLLSFMAHDRVALAGTMITIGILYPALSWFGIRRGLAWAKTAIMASAFTGFASFFFFLAFGYFDPFHAFVTVVLLQLLLLGLHAKVASAETPAEPDTPDTLAKAARLLLLGHNAVMIAGGCVISFVGSTHVFVPEDLEYMQTTAEALTAANARLGPLVAHDRASFGGMLIASGVCLFFTAWWGFQRGRRWLWWTLLAAGIPGYAAGIGVHFAIGYTNLWHLTPAISGALIYALALALAGPYLGRLKTSP